MSEKRKYELKKRAADMAETRRRITRAAVELHRTVGPARTTWSAIADRAEVQRQTVYRHFSSEAELLQACSSHYFAANPWPDLQPWRAMDDPDERLARALDELYAYYEDTAPMYENVLRDAEVEDVVRESVAPFESYLDEVTEVLEAGWAVPVHRSRVLTAALRHVVDFATWKSLTKRDGITRSDAVTLMTTLVEASAASPNSSEA